MVIRKILSNIFGLAVLVIALFSSVSFASLASDFAVNNVPASYFSGSSEKQTVFNVVLPAIPQQSGVDILYLDSIYESLNGSALYAINSSTKYYGTTTAFKSSYPVIYDVNNDNVFSSVIDQVIVGSSPPEGSTIRSFSSLFKITGQTFTNNVDIFLDANLDGKVTLKSDKTLLVGIVNYGTANSSDITVKMWQDTNLNLNLDSSDSLIGTMTAIEGNVWTTNVPIYISENGTRVFITVDVLPDAIHTRTIKMGIPDSGFYVASLNDGPIGDVVNEYVQAIDKSTPTVIINNAPVANILIKSNFGFSFSCSDDLSAISSMTYNFAGDSDVVLTTDSSTSYSGDVQVSSVPDNYYNFTMKCKDSVGNEAKSSVPIVIDRTAPVVTFDSYSAYSRSKTVNLTGTITDLFSNINTAKITYKGGSDNYMPPVDSNYNSKSERFAINKVFISDGSWDISIFVKDDADNTKTYTFPLVVDATIPSTIAAASVVATSRKVFDINYSLNDGLHSSGIVSVKLFYRINNGSYSEYASVQNGTFKFNVSTLGLYDGVYDFYTIAQDTAGNIESFSGAPDVTVLIDSTLPSSPEILQTSSGVVGSSFTLKWLASLGVAENIKGYIVYRSFDSENYTNITNVIQSLEYTDALSNNGLVFYKVSTVDKNDNLYESMPINVTADNSGPVFTNILSQQVSQIGTLINFTVNISDVGGINNNYVFAYVTNESATLNTYQLTKISEGVYSFSLDTSSYTEGLYYVNIEANDIFGNNRFVNRATMIFLKNSSSSSTKPSDIFTNSSVYTVENMTTTIQSNVGVSLDLAFNKTSIGTVNIVQFTENPTSSTNGVSTLLAFGKYYDIYLSSEINSTLTGATLKISYTDSEVSAAGLDATTLKIYLWDGVAWTQMPSTVNTQEKYVSATVPHFSIYAMFGSAPAPPPATGGNSGSSGGSGGSGGGGGVYCEENWECTEYSACSINGVQNRTCVDKNRCYSAKSKPELSKSCIYALCGNGIKEKGEECDLKGASCTTQDGYIGKQLCSSTCKFDVCKSEEKCGDNICNGKETANTCASDCRIETPTAQVTAKPIDPYFVATIILGVIVVYMIIRQLTKKKDKKTSS